MPLLFYFPFIVWMGMVKVVQDEMRVPQPAHEGQSNAPRMRCRINGLPSAVSHLDFGGCR